MENIEIRRAVPGDEALILPGPNLLAAGTLDFRLIIMLHKGDLSFLYNDNGIIV